MTDLHALPAALIVPPEKAGPFLRTLGIDLADLYASIAAGEAAAAGLDGFAPPMASGIVRWISVVSAVRRGLAESGEWIPGERRGQPVSRHLASGRTLTVMSGDVATGNPEFAFGPHTVRRKGAATADSFQPDEVLFPLSELCPVPRFDGALAGTWVFLYRADGDAVHLEVSQPTGFDQHSGQFTGWAVRVILDDWRPADRREHPAALGAHLDLQLVRSVA